VRAPKVALVEALTFTFGVATGGTVLATGFLADGLAVDLACGVAATTLGVATTLAFLTSGLVADFLAVGLAGRLAGMEGIKNLD
jgi:hypothetical protein